MLLIYVYYSIVFCSLVIKSCYFNFDLAYTVLRTCAIADKYILVYICTFFFLDLYSHILFCPYISSTD